MRNLAKDEIEMAARREAMLEHGFRLFSEKGIEAVTMLEVSRACCLGIATLYRYYKTKLALVIDISVKQWGRFVETVQTERNRRDADSMTAAEELRFYMDLFVELYREHKDLLRFSLYFNEYVLRGTPEQELLQPYMDVIESFVGMFHVIYEKGQRDGTIRTELPEEKMLVATSHVMMAAATRFAEGLVYSTAHKEDRTDELVLLRDMILNTFVQS